MDVPADEVLRHHLVWLRFGRFRAFASETAAVLAILLLVVPDRLPGSAAFLALTDSTSRLAATFLFASLPFTAPYLPRWYIVSCLDPVILTAFASSRW